MVNCQKGPAVDLQTIIYLSSAGVGNRQLSGPFLLKFQLVSAKFFIFYVIGARKEIWIGNLYLILLV